MNSAPIPASGVPGQEGVKVGGRLEAGPKRSGAGVERLGLLFAVMPRHSQRAGDPSLGLVIGAALLLAVLARVVVRILRRMVD
jgi:hypothetical protein